MNFNDAIEKRRSIYGLSKEATVSIDKIEEIIKFSLKHTPTPFNIQNGRAVLLTGDKADFIWQLTEDKLRAITDEGAFKAAKEKLDSFRNSFATIAFFEDTKDVKELQEKFPLYKDSFPEWSSQAMGILIGNVWVGLATVDMGASLQHYQNLIGEDLKRELKLPESWKMVAQMPIGKIFVNPGTKEFKSLDEMYRKF